MGVDWLPFVRGDVGRRCYFGLNFRSPFQASRVSSLAMSDRRQATECMVDVVQAKIDLLRWSNDSKRLNAEVLRTIVELLQVSDDTSSVIVELFWSNDYSFSVNVELLWVNDDFSSVNAELFWSNDYSWKLNVDPQKPNVHSSTVNVEYFRC